MILFADKPTGITSFDVVHKVKKHFGYKKVGHCWTLDPLATGLMVLVTDEDTKKAEEYQWFDKAYEATIDLSLKTDTWDIDFHDFKEEFTGEHDHVTIDVIKNELDKLVPLYILPIPAFSAKKVAGKRMYKSARAGKEIKVDREMNIAKYEIIEFNWPLLTVSFDVGSGTFIRSIAHRLGEQLHTGGVICALRRTRIAGWKMDELPELITFNKNETGYRWINVKKDTPAKES